LVSASLNKDEGEHKKSIKWAVSFSGISFRCPLNCDLCCRRPIGPSLTVKDYQRITQHLSYSNFADKRAHPLFPYQLKVKNGACIFLDKKGKCSIYSVRPLLCRLYPLQLHFQWDGKLLWCLEHCPGVGSEKGISFSEPYIENLLHVLIEIEGDVFFNDLREYVLQTKQPLTPLFKIGTRVAYSSWPTKIQMKDIVREMFHAEALGTLTPRGRLECIFQELLPSLKEIVLNKAEELPGEKRLLVRNHVLCEAYIQYIEVFSMLSFESVVREKIHLKNLETKGNIAYGVGEQKIIRHKQQDSIIIHGFNGRKIEINTSRLMRNLKIEPEAVLVEEEYLDELQRREGRFGKASTDLTVNSEVLLMFLAADALELKANAFAIERGKDTIGIAQIKEAVWIVERALLHLFEIVQKKDI
jgi:Fe-S-cluster containining protein